jgi:predicted acylesterase/phospholipase RssA
MKWPHQWWFKIRLTGRSQHQQEFFMDSHDLKASNPGRKLPRKTVALVLGSGSSRGWAHIGAIEALEEEGIPIDFISGCSVGSYVGAIYASGSLASLKKFVLSRDGKKVFSHFDVVFPRSGLLDDHETAETVIKNKVKELLGCDANALLGPAA